MFSLRLVKIILLFVLTLSGTSCAIALPKQYRINSKVYSDTNSGIIIGRLTNKISNSSSDSFGGDTFVLKNEQTEELINYGIKLGKKLLFFMRLPLGVYRFYVISSTNGELVSKGHPLRFKVEVGKVKYVGSIANIVEYTEHYKLIAGNPLFFNNSGVSRYCSAYVSLNYKKITDITDLCVNYYVIDESDEIIRRFKEKYPKYEDENVVVDLIKTNK